MVNEKEDIKIRAIPFTGRSGLEFTWCIFINGKFNREYRYERRDLVTSFLKGYGLNNSKINQMFEEEDKRVKEMMG